MYVIEQTPATHKAIATSLQEQLVNAQPRLLRYVQKHSLLPDSVEDIVQETLVEAWRHLEQLRAADRFDSWLTGICHNVCMRWNHAYHIQNRRFLRSAYLYTREIDTEEGERAESAIAPGTSPIVAGSQQRDADGRRSIWADSGRREGCRLAQDEYLVSFLRAASC
jgi:DNA-directed RNA polymerase specialized sigma24 family protein